MFDICCLLISEQTARGKKYIKLKIKLSFSHQGIKSLTVIEILFLKKKNKNC